MIKVTPLQSGSAGNCTLIESNETKILIDFGLFYSQICERLIELGTNIDCIDGILITHEHSDHIKAIEFAKTSLVYATRETLELKIKDFNEIIPYQSFKIKDLEIIPLSISHDAINPIGFVINDSDQKLVYITDTGMIKKTSLSYTKDPDIIMIESNYNDILLMRTNRPYFLKRRIASKKGHLSNIECGKYLVGMIGPKTKKIIFAHISEEANTHEQVFLDNKFVLDSFGIDYSDIKLICAKRYEITKED